jgi:predicted RNase H-like HicB family nuclease
VTDNKDKLLEKVFGISKVEYKDNCIDRDIFNILKEVIKNSVGMDLLEKKGHIMYCLETMNLDAVLSRESIDFHMNYGTYSVVAVLDEEHHEQTKGRVYRAFCPYLPGCNGEGNSLEEAIEDGIQSLQLLVESYLENSEVPWLKLPDFWSHGLVPLSDFKEGEDIMFKSFNSVEELLNYSHD